MDSRRCCVFRPWLAAALAFGGLIYSAVLLVLLPWLAPIVLGPHYGDLTWMVVAWSATTFALAIREGYSMTLQAVRRFRLLRDHESLVRDSGRTALLSTRHLVRSSGGGMGDRRCGARIRTYALDFCPSLGSGRLSAMGYALRWSQRGKTIERLQRQGYTLLGAGIRGGDRTWPWRSSSNQAVCVAQRGRRSRGRDEGICSSAVASCPSHLRCGYTDTDFDCGLVPRRADYGALLRAELPRIPEQPALSRRPS